MFRKVIAEGDLVIEHKPWYSFGQYTMYRNLSEEVRYLKQHEEKARAKYLDLAQTHVIAKTNVAAELETLQILLLENSEAYFEVSVDNSILDKREGLRYNFGHSNQNNKKGNSSSNKEHQQKQQQNNQQKGSQKPKGIPLSELFLKGRISLQ